MSAEVRKNFESGKRNFRTAFDPIIHYYQNIGGGFSNFYNDYQNGNIPDEIQLEFQKLCSIIRWTIVNNSMYHLGYSIGKEHNQIFSASGEYKRPPSKSNIDPQFLVDNYGEFFVAREYYDAFNNVGPFLIGDNSLLFRWAQFTENKIEKDQIKFGDILKIIAKYPVEERDCTDSNRFYDHLKQKGITIRSIWSKKPIYIDIERALDHLIPFSVWKNNDLWNILPALRSENAQKSDKIPYPDLLEAQKGIILEYWSYMMEFKPSKFRRQISHSLIGSNLSSSNWHEQAFVSLKKKCSPLINVLGYEDWKND